RGSPWRAFPSSPLPSLPLLTALLPLGLLLLLLLRGGLRFLLLRGRLALRLLLFLRGGLLLLRWRGGLLRGLRGFPFRRRRLRLLHLHLFLDGLHESVPHEDVLSLRAQRVLLRLVHLRVAARGGAAELGLREVDDDDVAGRVEGQRELVPERGALRRRLLRVAHPELHLRPLQEGVVPPRDDLEFHVTSPCAAGCRARAPSPPGPRGRSRRPRRAGRTRRPRPRGRGRCTPGPGGPPRPALRVARAP